MEQPIYILEDGTRVVTHAKLGSTKGMFAKPETLAARRTSASGVISGAIPGYGGDVYWVTHDDGQAAPYCFTEFELESAGGGR